MASPVTTDLPSRTTTGLSAGNEDAVPDLDPTTVGAFSPRKHCIHNSWNLLL